MLKTLTAAAAFALALCATAEAEAPAASRCANGDLCTVVRIEYACPTQETFIEYRKIIRSRDIDGALDYAARHGCIRISANDKLYQNDWSEWSDISKVRKFGSGVSYWTSHSVLGEKTGLDVAYTSATAAFDAKYAELMMFDDACANDLPADKYLKVDAVYRKFTLDWNNANMKLAVQERRKAYDTLDALVPTMQKMKMLKPAVYHKQACARFRVALKKIAPDIDAMFDTK